MNLLLDTNVILDVLLAREPWLHEAEQIWQACEEQQLTGYIVASAITDIFYIARRLVGVEKATKAVELCLDTFVICPVDRAILEAALRIDGNDFEDNVQLAAAMWLGLDAIVTRNPVDFAATALPILTPAQILSQLP